MNLKKTRFTEMIIRSNGLDEEKFQNWVFCRGMDFNSPDKWWGDYGRRDFPHEGIDLCLFGDSAGELYRLDETTRVPVMHGGVIMAMFKDFLGKAVIVGHDIFQGKKERLLTVYAHTEPRADLKPGSNLETGEIIGTIADTSHSKSKILPHLHFTLARLSKDLVSEPFEWNFMRDPEKVSLLDPFPLIDRPCRVMDASSQFCSDI